MREDYKEYWGKLKELRQRGIVLVDDVIVWWVGDVP